MTPNKWKVYAKESVVNLSIGVEKSLILTYVPATCHDCTRSYFRSHSMKLSACKSTILTDVASGKYSFVYASVEAAADRKFLKC